jgi:hypothetical protein
LEPSNPLYLCNNKILEVGYDNNYNNDKSYNNNGGSNYNSERKNDSVFSKRLKAGKRRTYFFDVRSTKSNDYFLTITESVKRFNDDGYDRHKVFIYKEDFNKFVKGLSETVDHIKTELMPDFDFDQFNHEYDDENGEGGYKPRYENNNSASTTATTAETAPIAADTTPMPEATPGEAPSMDTEVDKW